MNIGGVAAAIKRAEHRCNVISSLDEAYSTSSKSSAKEVGIAKLKEQHSILAASQTSGAASSSRDARKAPSNVPASKKVAVVVDALIGDYQRPENSAAQRDYDTLLAVLENKSIVLDNAKLQSDAAKSSLRKRRAQELAKPPSKRYLKKHDLYEPLRAPSLNDLILIHDAWMGYYLAAVADAQPSQIPSRIQGMALLGAKAIVCSSDRPDQVGKLGVIVSQSASSYYLACSSSAVVKVKSSASTNSSGVCDGGISSRCGNDINDSNRTTKLKAQDFVQRSQPSVLSTEITSVSAEEQHQHQQQEVQVVATVKMHRINKKSKSVSMSLLLPGSRASRDAYAALCASTVAAPVSSLQYLGLEPSPHSQHPTAAQLNDLLACINSIDPPIYTQACMLYGGQSVAASVM